MLVEVERIALPAHQGPGGFDHAAIDPRTDRLFVAHTANGSVDVVDLAARRYLRSLTGLKGVAGVWINEARRLLFTSNRGEDTASVFRLEDRSEVERHRVPTGVRPNGMAFDERRGTWLIAGVGDPGAPDAPPTLTFVHAEDGTTIGRIRAPGRTRWALFHAPSDAFYINIADPPAIVSVRADDPSRLARSFPIPARGPHGLEQDLLEDRLYCAADEGGLFALTPSTGEVARIGSIDGAPDVLWMDRERGRLYAATDEPATVHIYATRPATRLGTYPTAGGAHTLTVDPKRHEVHVFLPATHEDLVLRDRTGPAP